MIDPWFDEEDDLDLIYFETPPADDASRFAEWFKGQPEYMKRRVRVSFPRLVAAIERELVP
jgi:hypothetical protein